MREYLTEAIVLDREISGETDARIFLYTKELGRVMARARSAGFITSRLSSYLQPLRRVQARLVEKNGIQVVDALPLGERGALSSEKVGLCQIIRSLTSEHHPDEQLWHEIASAKPSALRILTILGFDPRHATCGSCSARELEYFSSRDAHYYCAKCVRVFSSIEGLYRLGRVSDAVVVN